MVKIVTEQSAQKYIELLVDGKIETEEMNEVFAQIEKRIAEWGDVLVLEEVRDIGQVEFGAFWKDLRFGLKNMGSFPRVAVVTDISWVQKITKLADPMFTADIRVFSLAEKEVAKNWLLQGNVQQEQHEAHP
ncbi:STAS/SEC14 domain-containing protein [Bdellovibrio sp. HCB337]|uniref:STAS/SEC14 domain-containing protein n=1 Tax=Bdellovibrio sp. HCB337 TaxID=3394358 RepID=UPI0039A64BF5